MTPSLLMELFGNFFGNNYITEACAYYIGTSISIMLCFQPCSTHYIAVQINSYLKSSFLIKIATEKYRQFSLLSHADHKIDTFAVSKDEWNTK